MVAETPLPLTWPEIEICWKKMYWIPSSLICLRISWIFFFRSGSLLASSRVGVGSAIEPFARTSWTVVAITPLLVDRGLHADDRPPRARTEARPGGARLQGSARDRESARADSRSCATVSARAGRRSALRARRRPRRRRRRASGRGAGAGHRR